MVGVTYLCSLHVKSLHSGAMQIRAPRTHNVGRLAEAVGLGVLTIVTMFVLSYTLGTCVDVPDWHASGYGYTFHCTEGEGHVLFYKTPLHSG